MARRLIVLVALLLAGCAKKPSIPGYHWQKDWRSEAADLFDDRNGKRVASVVVVSNVTQACVFIQEGSLTCEFYEKEQQAYDWIEREFREARMRNEGTGE